MVTSHNVRVYLELFYTTYKQTVVLTAEVAYPGAVHMASVTNVIYFDASVPTQAN